MERYSCSWIERPNSVNIAVFLKFIYKFNIIPTFQQVYVPIQMDSKLFRQCKRPRISRTIFKKKNKIKELILCNFKADYKAVKIKTGWY